LAIALKAKEADWLSQLDSIDPTLQPYDSVPNFVNYNLFVVWIISLLS